MLRHSFQRADEADRIERAVRAVLAEGYRTADILQPGTRRVGTAEMGDAVVAAMHASDPEHPRQRRRDQRVRSCAQDDTHLSGSCPVSDAGKHAVAAA